MLQIRSAILSAALAFAVACIARSAHAGDTIAATPDHIQAQIRWVKAERDKSNALLAQGFVRSKSSQDNSGDAATAPHVTTSTASGKPE